MDRIEQLMKDAKPRVQEPGTIPGIISDRSSVFSTDPNVVSPARRKPPRWTVVRAAAAVVLAAAVVVGAVVVGGNLVLQPSPEPADTGIPSISASPAPTPTPTVSGTLGGELSTNGVACTVANIDQQRNVQVRAITPIPSEHWKYYTVLGCAEGWLAYSISDEGIGALGLDGGNAWYTLAMLQENRRFLTDFQQPWSSVYTWEFQALISAGTPNGQHLTAQQAMDREFADKGIPVGLRPQLVGEGPPAASGAGAPQARSTYTIPDGRVIFRHPAP